jgi:hypothetical protein
MNFAEWWSPGAAQDAAIDARVAEWLWQDAEERRKKAWLRKIGFVTRLLIYACAFGVLFYFTPQGLQDGWLFTRPFSALTLSDVLGALVWVLIGIKLGHALFNPNPRPDFREQLGWLGVGIIGLLALAATAIYLLL